jgi:hypothetical protein
MQYLKDVNSNPTSRPSSEAHLLSLFHMHSIGFEHFEDFSLSKICTPDR